MERNGVPREKRSVDWIYGEDFINYFSEPPTLQHITAVSIAIGLWTEPDMKSDLIKYSSGSCELEERILNRLFNSSLPALLKTEVSYIIRPIELELLKFYGKYPSDYHRFCQVYMNRSSIYWTTEGTIDVVRSLKELCMEENSETDVCNLYEAACSCCLEEYISGLWEKIPTHKKSQFRTAYIGDVYKHHLVFYWTFAIEDRLDIFLNKIMRLDHENIYDHNLSIDLNMITCSVRICNLFALKYFWGKLSEQEKNANLKKWIFQAIQLMKISEYGSYYDKVRPLWDGNTEMVGIFCFLLSHVRNPSLCLESLQIHSIVLVSLFQNWPCQRFFLPTILGMLHILEEEVYLKVMRSINSNMRKVGIEGKFFRAIWNGTPLRLKRSFFRNLYSCSQAILHLLIIGELSMALMLLEDASEEEEKRIVCHMFGWRHFHEFIYSYDLTLICTLLSQTTLPPDCALSALKPEKPLPHEQEMYYRYDKNIWHICNEWIFEGNYKAVETFLKWAFQSSDEIIHFKKNKLYPFWIYIKLIIRRDYACINQFLSWYFVSVEEIRQFIWEFLYKDNMYYFKFLVEDLFVKGSAASDVLEKFFNFILSSSVDVTEFKIMCLNYVEIVIDRHKYELATILLNWSLNSIDEVKRYKNNFVLSGKRIEKLPPLHKFNMNHSDWRSMEEMIKWSSPLSTETVTKLKSLIRDQEWWYSYKFDMNLKITALFDLLDSVVEKDSNSEFVGNSEHDCIMSPL